MTIYKTNIDKNYLNFIVDQFESDVLSNTNKNFNKRSSITRKGGRPYLYSPREIGEDMIMYFCECVEKNQPFMITGLCFKIGISRRGLLNLEKSSNREFVHTIQKGKSIVESYLETQLHLKQNPGGIIFILKNMGWSDK